MRISRSLNLVIPVDGTELGTVYVHSTPISREIWKQHWLVLAKTFSRIQQEGLGSVAGPKVAAEMLEEVARDTRGRNGSRNAWEGPDGVENSLLPEIRRLTNVVIPNGDGGWVTAPYEDVLRKDTLPDEDKDEILNAIVFFISSSSLTSKSLREEILNGMALLWGAQIVSVNSTEFARSLPTSTETANSGETVPT